MADMTDGMDAGTDVRSPRPDEELAQAGLAQMLSKRAVMAATGLSPSGLHLAMKKRGFPAPVRPSPGRVAWIASEVAEWQRQRIAERDAREIAA